MTSSHPLSAPAMYRTNTGLFPIRHISYKLESTRLDSFQNWSKSEVVSPAVLSKAGFFYSGESDVVTCYYCDLNLCDWKIGDDAFLEHIRYSPACPYVSVRKDNFATVFREESSKVCESLVSSGG